MIWVGNSYYYKNLELKAQGLSERGVLEKIIKEGIKEENGILGFAMVGVFSFGDLEANFQGLKMGQDFCEGDSPGLKLVNGKWVQNKKLDLKNYVNPLFDESYNVSYYSKKTFNSIKDKLTRYCAIRHGPEVKKRFHYYETFGSILRSNKIAQDIDQQSFESLCAKAELL